MASVEGMWAFLTGTTDDPKNLSSGGILVLETGRVFGGDSAMAYLGHYEFDAPRITAKVRTWVFDTAAAESGVENVFGMRGHIDHVVVFEGNRHSDDEIRGMLHPEGAPDAKVLAKLKKVSDLP